MVTLELFDSPHYCRFISFILSFTNTSRENLNFSWICWNRNFNDDIISNVWMFVDGSNLYWVFYPVVFNEFLNDWSNFERQIDILGNSICHNFKNTIWRNKSDRSISIKSCKFNTLMEFNIIDLNTFLLSFLCICCLSIVRFSN